MDSSSSIPNGAAPTSVIFQEEVYMLVIIAEKTNLIMTRVCVKKPHFRQAISKTSSFGFF